jgi:ribosome-interacting GTPase 1
MDLFDIVKNLFGMEAIIKLVSTKLKNDYGIERLSVKRTSDSVLLVIQSESSERLDKIESDLASSIAQLHVGDKSKTIKVKVED